MWSYSICLPLQEDIIVVSFHALCCDLLVLLQQTPDGITQRSVQTTLPIKCVCLTFCSCKMATDTRQQAAAPFTCHWMITKQVWHLAADVSLWSLMLLCFIMKIQLPLHLHHLMLFFHHFIPFWRHHDSFILILVISVSARFQQRSENNLTVESMTTYWTLTAPSEGISALYKTPL